MVGMKFRLTTVVWGEWHVDAFLRYGLPSLLAPGNLDAIDYTLAIHTSPRDAGRLMPALRGLKREIYTPIYTKPIENLAVSAGIQQMMHRFDRRHARKSGAVWACVPPDVVWGEGTFARYRAMLETGKTAVFHHMPRVEIETAAAAIGGDFSRRNLARVALDHEHPLGRMHRADNPAFPPHCELAIWPAGGGLLSRMMSSEIKLADPVRVPINEAAQAAQPLGLGMGVIQDADEAMALSLAPVYKDRDWARDGAPLSAQMARDFLAKYPSPATRELARYSYRLHAGNVSPAAWVAAERQADTLMATIFDGWQPRECAA